MILIFGPFSMQIGIILCTRAKKSVVNMQWTDWDFIEKEKNTCPTFAEVISTCGTSWDQGCHGTKV
jgi:hypothetical protein